MKEKRNLYQILQVNEEFINNREYEKYQTGMFPDKRLVILTCMDTRLVELLERATGIRQGDVKMVKVAGGRILHPFDSAMQSVLIAVHVLQADEVIVIGHHDCGLQNMNPETFAGRMMEKGVSPKTLEMMEYAGIDLEDWLQPFESVEESVRHTVTVIKNHPFMAEANIPVHGLVIDPRTGKLDLVVDGYDVVTH
jgi:carbonic anhydrase